MHLDRVVEDLQIGDSVEAFEEDWDEARAGAPEGTPSFLEPEAVREASEIARIPEVFLGDIVAAAEEIGRKPSASALAWHAYWWMHETDDFSFERVRSWPRLVDPLGETGALLYLISLIAGHGKMRAIHRRHEIPDQVVADTLSQIELYLRTTSEVQGFPEVLPYLVAWLMNHYRGEIYRLARLQFQFRDSHYRIRVFRSSETGQVVALSEDGVRYRPDGQILRDVDDPGGSWEAQLSVEDGVAAGNPIVPEGRALPDQITLPLDEWKQELAPGDPVLAIHIPGGESMDYDQCGAAFEQALEFFPRHFPNYDFSAFTCASWILDTAIQELAPSQSNMVRFQREVYLFPVGLREDSLYSGLFGGIMRYGGARPEPPEDLSKAPRDTSLQRAYLDAMEGQGVVSAAGGCFLLPEDVDWGSQVYLSQPPIVV